MPNGEGIAKANADGRHQQTLDLEGRSATELSINIKCDACVINLLALDTIALANCIVKGMEAENSGLFVQSIDQNALHQALALSHSPVPQGTDADASIEAYRAWLINGARNVRFNSQVPQNSPFSLAFYQSHQGEAVDICCIGYTKNGRFYFEKIAVKLPRSSISQFCFLNEQSTREYLTDAVECVS